VADVYGDGRHVNIDVVSAAFEGKSSVARQRMVYKVRWIDHPVFARFGCVGSAAERCSIRTQHSSAWVLAMGS
jgi:hypothetical protein